MAKTRPPSARDLIGKPGGFSFATGGFLPEREPEREPDMSKMPALTPMPSHTPNAPISAKARSVTRPTKRSPAQRALISGGR